MSKKATIIQDQNQEKEIPKEILAEAIVRISESMKALNVSGLNRKAIVALVSDDTKIGKGTITAVLDSLTELRNTYCRK